MNAFRFLILCFVLTSRLSYAGGFPETPGVVDISKPPYGIKGDGVTDHTAALQLVLNENVGHHRLIYFPDGIYLISATLKWPKRFNEHDNWGKTYLCGQSRAGTILRLRDATFTDEKMPSPMMWCGGFGSADWFHNYIEHFTFSIGKGNSGASGLQFYSNNTGAVRDCLFTSDDGLGITGLDLAHRDMNGPLLVRGVEVRGFRTGIHTARAVNSQTFENITLSGQAEVAFQNEGQSVSIRHLTSYNAVPAIMTYGALCIIDSKLTGHGDALKRPAIVNFNGGTLMVRDVRTDGYGVALRSVSSPDAAKALRLGVDMPDAVQGPLVKEYFSSAPLSPFPSRAASLRLPVEETPESPNDDPAQWANVESFGADPAGKLDSAPAIQQAIDSGATTIFFPGQYLLKSTVTVRGKARRLLGCGVNLDYFGHAKPDLRVEDGDGSVFIEHFSNVGGGMEIATDRTVVLKSVCSRDVVSKGTGDLFFEDVCSHDLSFTKQRVWARQLNVENKGTHMRNNGGTLWVLGYKTERGGTLLETVNGGSSELFGNFSYTTSSGSIAPMFITRDASVFAWFREICYHKEPFEIIVEETRRGTTKTVRRNEGIPTPYISTASEEPKNRL